MQAIAYINVSNFFNLGKSILINLFMFNLVRNGNGEVYRLQFA